MSTQRIEPSVIAPRRWRVVAVRVAVGLACLTMSGGISFGIAQFVDRPGEVVELEPRTIRHEELDPLVRIDDLIASGDLARALALAKATAGEEETPRAAPVRFRAALCQEYLGDTKAAMRSFEQIASWRPAAALFGKARCLARNNQHVEATATLDRLAPLATIAAARDLGIAAEVAYWRAILQIQSSTETRLDVLDPHCVRSAELTVPVQRYLRWAEVDGLSLSAERIEPAREPEMPATGAVARRRSRLAVEQALAADGDHPLAPALRIEIANMDAAEGRPAAAAAAYELLLTDALPASLAAVVEFNAGLCSLRAGDQSRARVALLQALDLGTGPELTGMAWWFVARTYLDAGDPSHAARPLRRAASGSEPRGRAAAVLAQCAIDLTGGNDAAVHDALAGVPSAHLRAAGLRDEAAVYDALARLRLARQVRPRPGIETEDLLSALSATRGPAASLGPMGGLVRALACNEVGLTGSAAEVLVQTLPAARGALAVRMMEMLADCRLREHRLDDARSVLRSLLSAEDAGVRSRVRLKLAGVELSAGRPEECLALCRGMALEGDEVRAVHLALLGRAYSALNDSRRAAECFAGRYPSD